jgi:hypothetical protein
MAEKIYNQLVQEIQKFHEKAPVLISAYERALKFEDLDILKGFSKVILLNFRPWVRSFPMWLGHIYGNCPETEVRRFLLEDMQDEDQKDPHPLAGDGHVGLHRRLILALGCTEKEVDDLEAFPPTILTVIHSFFEFARTYPWQEGAAAIMSAEMTNVRQIPKVFPDQIELTSAKAAGNSLMWTIIKKLVLGGAIKREDAAFLFAHDWTLLDDLEGKPFEKAMGTELKHVGYVLRMLTVFTSPEKHEGVLKMFRRGLQMFRTYYDTMGRLGHEYLDKIAHA